MKNCAKCPNPATVEVAEYPTTGPAKRYQACDTHEPVTLPAGVIRVDVRPIN